MLGANDLEQQHYPSAVPGRLQRFQALYALRSVGVAFVPIGPAGPDHIHLWPEYEASRIETNRMLEEIVHGAVVVDIDALLADLPPDVWHEGWHLFSDGYGTVGRRLGEALSPRCQEIRRMAPDVGA